MTIFVIIFFPFLMSLGTWQIVRGFDKQDILDQYDFNKALVPIESYELSMEGMGKELLQNRIFRRAVYAGVLFIRQ